MSGNTRFQKIAFLMVPVLVLMYSSIPYAQSSTHYDIEIDVISGGGGGTSSTHYDAYSTLGQSSPIGTSTSTHYVNHSGFWHAFLGATLEPDITMTPNHYDFKRVFVADSSPPHTFTVSNPGTGNLVIGTIARTGSSEFSIQNDHCSGQTLIPKGSCTFEVVFSPTLPLGVKAASLSIPSNDPDGTVEVPLSGRGVLLMVDPEEGTIGSHITIAVKGSAFGSTKGKVLVGATALKVVTWGSDSISSAMDKFQQTPGKYNLIVQRKDPRGAPPITEPGGFTVKLPEITGGPYHGSPGANVTSTGKFFGTKKGKVYLGSTSCKVVSWTMNVTTGESTVVFVVSKKLARGPYDLTVTNKLGSGTAKFNVD